MSRYNANTIIEGRYLLIESISHDSKSGRQVWSAKDNQTGKRVLGRFESNGKVEWFPDTRTLASNSSKQKTSTAPKIVIPTVKLPQSSSTFRRFIPLLLLFGIGLITVAYYQKNKIRDFWGAKFNSSNNQKTEEDQQEVDEAIPNPLSADTTLSNANSLDRQPSQPTPTPPVTLTTESRPVVDSSTATPANQNAEQNVDSSNPVGTALTVNEKPRLDEKPKRDHYVMPKLPKKRSPPKQKQNTYVTDSELNKN